MQQIVKQGTSKYFTLAQKLEKKIQFELEKISSWFQTGKKIQFHQTGYLKLENWKNPVQIDRGTLFFLKYHRQLKPERYKTYVNSRFFDLILRAPHRRLL